MPLAEEYRDLLDSAVADANNAPGKPGVRRRPRCSCGPSPATCPGPTSTSPARPAPAPTTREMVKGGTGFGARTLLRWLEAGAPVDAPETVLD